MTKCASLLIDDLIRERGAIVSAGDCGPMEIAFARAEGRFYVAHDGLGFVLRPREWRANAEAALHDVAEQHRKDKASLEECDG